jgi:DEAD/DEAH box helicase domain-containing protein
VDSLDLDDDVAVLHPDDPPYSTSARDLTDIAITGRREHVAWGPAEVSTGTVRVTHQVVSYVRKQLRTGEILGEELLDLPERILDTSAVWWTLPDDVLEEAGFAGRDLPGAAHAAEHASIGLLPLFATCDRWDIGGVSTARHPDTGILTVFVYDGHPGGAGFAERGFRAAAEWLTATREAIDVCQCLEGCPSCVQSPKCGNNNNPLDKAGAVAMLDVLLRHAPRTSR